jgi:hypothetical protein
MAMERVTAGTGRTRRIFGGATVFWALGGMGSQQVCARFYQMPR